MKRMMSWKIRCEAAGMMRTSCRLDEMPGVDVYIALHGNTGCICIQVTENKSLVYENRCFRTNYREMREMRRELAVMLRQKRRERK